MSDDRKLVKKALDAAMKELDGCEDACERLAGRGADLNMLTVVATIARVSGELYGARESL